MPITDWPTDERPREKLLQHGASSLSDAELLAIFLRVGIPGKNAVDLARELLQHFGSLTELFDASLTELCRIPGMGAAKYSQLQAILEMSRRALGEQLSRPQALSQPAAVRDYLRLWLGGEDRECFGALFMDTQHGLISAEVLFRGTLDQASVHPREIARRALQLNAGALIIAHNHPSGVSQPSEADLHLTRTVKQALSLLDIRLLDHFVVTRHGSHSLAEHGQM
ncbi:DNA repair protein RadC [Chitinimonas viridis]|uniref:DNA repair protein RadC n=1 Tax=Chitinimonas viridis TaxID=664880 RepID=A0ABT8B362_9NEIS|nr:DNA repair protein RadC [Chitinimonas viridis]MDN3576265.1 DNA repair protein RadC [Chitinimonas viridis]